MPVGSVDCSDPSIEHGGQTLVHPPNVQRYHHDMLHFASPLLSSERQTVHRLILGNHGPWSQSRRHAHFASATRLHHVQPWLKGANRIGRHHHFCLSSPRSPFP